MLSHVLQKGAYLGDVRRAAVLVFVIMSMGVFVSIFMPAVFMFVGVFVIMFAGVVMVVFMSMSVAAMFVVVVMTAVPVSVFMSVGAVFVFVSVFMSAVFVGAVLPGFVSFVLFFHGVASCQKAAALTGG
ncbi:MAG: hypothetical protein LBH15_06820 [Treponema sp.]|nr:hypothetical protein [Treponema sp.]